MYQPVFDKQRFKALMLYLAHENRDSDTFGLTKLSKLLYYCDTRAFVRTGKSITGSEYLKEKRGPLPRHLYETMRELQEEAEATLQVHKIGFYSQMRLVPVGQIEPHRELFTDLERETIDETISDLWDMTAEQISEYSHGEIGWQVTPEREPIPYESAYFVSDYDHDTNELFDAANAARGRE